MDTLKMPIIRHELIISQAASIWNWSYKEVNIYKHYKKSMHFSVKSSDIGLQFKKRYEFCTTVGVHNRDRDSQISGNQIQYNTKRYLLPSFGYFILNYVVS